MVLLVGRFPLKLLHSLVSCIKYYDTLVLLLLIKLLFVLVAVLDPNRHALAGFSCMLPFVLLRDVSFIVCPSDFLK